MTFEPIDYQVRDLLKELPDRLMGPKVASQPLARAFRNMGSASGRTDRWALDSTGVPILKVARRITREPGWSHRG